MLPTCASVISAHVSPDGSCNVSTNGDYANSSVVLSANEFAGCGITLAELAIAGSSITTVGMWAEINCGIVGYVLDDEFDCIPALAFAFD